MEKRKTKIVSFRVPEDVFAEIENQTELENYDQRADLVKDTFLPAFWERRARKLKKLDEPVFSA
jgi:Arc/MetJ-type ribon-helix-helix transcriptional regulator